MSKPKIAWLPIPDMTHDSELAADIRSGKYKVSGDLIGIPLSELNAMHDCWQIADGAVEYEDGKIEQTTFAVKPEEDYSTCDLCRKPMPNALHCGRCMKEICYSCTKDCPVCRGWACKECAQEVGGDVLCWKH